MTARRSMIVLVLWSCCEATSSRAQTIDLSWNACAPIVTERTTTPGSVVSCYASVTGMRSVGVAYRVCWVVGDDLNQLPDAWNFIATGCAYDADQFHSQPFPEDAVTCPPAIPPSIWQLVLDIYQLAPPAFGYPTTMGNAFLIVNYPSGAPDLDPARRYHLARFTFDFAHGVAGPGTWPAVFPRRCGGLDRPITIQLVEGLLTWVDASQVESHFAVGNGVIHMQSQTVPSRTATWGAIKRQYRF